MKRFFIGCIAVSIASLHAGKALSPGEQAAASQSSPKTEQNLSIAVVTISGDYIKMSDNSEWIVHPADRDVAGGWIGNADVRITCTKDPTIEYSCRILNKWTGSTVRAKPRAIKQ